MRVQENKFYARMMDVLDKESTVLDLGCGCGNPFINTKFKLLVGIDLYGKVFDMSEYDIIIYYDIRKVDELFRLKSFDAVTAIDTIEHLTKEEGYLLIKDCEDLARKLVMFFTPLIWSDNRDNTDNPKLWGYGNELNIHKSLWSEEDFRKLGYEIVPCQEGYVLAVKRL